MINEKLMKIVQAVNDSEGSPIDSHKANYNIVARYRCGEQYEINTVHAVHKSRCSDSWGFICTVEEFNQCVKEMSAGYGKKESDMKDNKHPHYDLIVEWAKDTSKAVQIKIQGRVCGWVDVSNPNWDETCEYRFKPREFVKGHWYPCVDEYGYSFIFIYDGHEFKSTDSEDYCGADDLQWIGESLGEINFGGGE